MPKGREHKIVNDGPEIKVGFGPWRRVVGVLPEHPFPVDHGNPDNVFDRQWILEDGTSVSPLNPNIERR